VDNAVTEIAFPVDARLIVAITAIVLSGIAKGVTGMGLPVVGVPILVALYGDLRLVLPLTVIATVLSDLAMLARWRKHVGNIRVLVVASSPTRCRRSTARKRGTGARSSA
jgi:uncharacterized membrane protein YfcA